MPHILDYIQTDSEIAVRNAVQVSACAAFAAQDAVSAAMRAIALMRMAAEEDEDEGAGDEEGAQVAAGRLFEFQNDHEAVCSTCEV
jgi:hypothetical protein